MELLLTLKKINYIHELIPFFDQLNSDEQYIVKEAITCRLLSEGEQLSEHHSDCFGLAMMDTGRIRAYILLPGDKEYTLFRMAEKDVGVLTASYLFNDLKIPVFFEVEKDCTVYLIPTYIIEEVSQTNINVKYFIMDHLTSSYSNALSIIDPIVLRKLLIR